MIAKTWCFVTRGIASKAPELQAEGVLVGNIKREGWK
jgi:hypothetical protein